MYLNLSFHQVKPNLGFDENPVAVQQIILRYLVNDCLLNGVFGKVPINLELEVTTCEKILVPSI